MESISNNFRYIDWRKLYLILIDLVESMLSQGYLPEVIYAVLKGGLIPARILSDILGIGEIGFIGVKYYKGIEERGEKPCIFLEPTIDINSRKVLIVDDIVDTGETLKKVLEILGEYNPSSLKTLTLYVKPWSTIKPDYYYRVVEEWVIFPWELGEVAEQRVEVDEDLLGEDYIIYRRLRELHDRYDQRFFSSNA